MSSSFLASMNVIVFFLRNLSSIQILLYIFTCRNLLLYFYTIYLKHTASVHYFCMNKNSYFSYFSKTFLSHQLYFITILSVKQMHLSVFIWLVLLISRNSILLYITILERKERPSSQLYSCHTHINPW